MIEYIIPAVILGTLVIQMIVIPILCITGVIPSIEEIIDRLKLD